MNGVSSRGQDEARPLSEPGRVGYVTGAVTVVAGLRDSSLSSGTGEAEHQVSRFLPLRHRDGRVVPHAGLQQRAVLKVHHLVYVRRHRSQ